MDRHQFFKKLDTGLAYLILVLLSLGVLLPVSWIVLSSLKPGTSLFSDSLLPKSLTIQNYIKLFTETNYLRWYRNTFILAVCNMILSVMVTTVTAYVLSRYRFKGRKQIMLGVLILQMFPSFLGMVAIYMLLSRLGLVNNYLGLLLVYVAGQVPFNTWLAKGYFDAIPYSLDEAARMDAGHFTVFRKIILPVARPIMVFLAMVNFIGPWFDFIFPKLLLKTSENFTVAVGIFNWVQETQNQFTLFASGSILVALPFTVLFFITQRYIVTGLEGAVKG